MSAAWSRRKGVEFERHVRRRLEEVFGKKLVRRGFRPLGAHTTADVVAPGVWVECKAQRRTNPRAALRQAAGGARTQGRWAVAVCKDDRRVPLVMMTFEEFVALLRQGHELRVGAR